jgi:hypothetical protein
MESIEVISLVQPSVVICAFPITATQTPAGSPNSLALITRTTPAWRVALSSPVQSISHCKQSRSSKSQTKQAFQMVLACAESFFHAKSQQFTYRLFDR